MHEAKVLLRLDSVAPLGRLPKIVQLEPRNIRLEDDDILSISSAFPKLKSLTLSSQFDRMQLADLSKKLNAQLEKPNAAYAKINASCRKCGGALYLFTGRRIPVLCMHCDRGGLKSSRIS